MGEYWKGEGGGKCFCIGSGAGAGTFLVVSLVRPTTGIEEVDEISHFNRQFGPTVSSTDGQIMEDTRGAEVFHLREGRYMML